MGVYIRDMTIEEFAEYGGEYAGYLIGTGQAEGIQDHGDLIDRDEAADDACLIWGRNSSGDDAAQEIIEHLRKMKAVIPAERSESDARPEI